MARSLGAAIAPAMEQGGARQSSLVLALCEGLKLGQEEAAAALAAASAREQGPEAAGAEELEAIKAENAALKHELAKLKAKGKKN